MKCSRCNRPLKFASVTSGGVALGPTCARLLGIALGKRIAVPVVQAGQLPLFVPEMRESST